jgi:hypothetical protein
MLPDAPSVAPSGLPLIPSGGAPYYLLNFERALAWLGERYDDVFGTDERSFLDEFSRLPQASRALLVRMLMRKGMLFRASRLNYDEIGCPLQAAAPLVALGWIDSVPHLSLDELFSLATRPELPISRRRKAPASRICSTRCVPFTTMSGPTTCGTRRPPTAYSTSLSRRCASVCA